jgi:hypothetical protein
MVCRLNAFTFVTLIQWVYIRSNGKIFKGESVPVLNYAS